MDLSSRAAAFSQSAKRKWDICCNVSPFNSWNFPIVCLRYIHAAPPSFHIYIYFHTLWTSAVTDRTDSPVVVPYIAFHVQCMNRLDGVMQPCKLAHTWMDEHAEPCRLCLHWSTHYPPHSNPAIIHLVQGRFRSTNYAFPHLSVYHITNLSITQKKWGVLFFLNLPNPKCNSAQMKWLLFVKKLGFAIK